MAVAPMADRCCGVSIVGREAGRDVSDGEGEKGLKR